MNALKILLTLALVLFTNCSYAAGLGMCGRDNSNSIEQDQYVNRSGPKVNRIIVNEHRFPKQAGESEYLSKFIRYYKDNKQIRSEYYNDKDFKYQTEDFTYDGNLLSHLTVIYYSEEKKGAVSRAEQSYFYDANMLPYKYEEIGYELPSKKKTKHIVTFVKRTQFSPDTFEDICLEYSEYGIAGDYAHLYDKGLTSVYKMGPEGVLHYTRTPSYSGSPNEESIYKHLSLVGNDSQKYNSGLFYQYETDGNKKVKSQFYKETGKLFRKEWYDEMGRSEEELQITYKGEESRKAYKNIYDNNGNLTKEIIYELHFNGMAAEKKYSFIKWIERSIDVQYKN